MATPTGEARKKPQFLIPNGKTPTPTTSAAAATPKKSTKTNNPNKPPTTKKHAKHTDVPPPPPPPFNAHDILMSSLESKDSKKDEKKDSKEEKKKSLEIVPLSSYGLEFAALPISGGFAVD